MDEPHAIHPEYNGDADDDRGDNDDDNKNDNDGSDDSRAKQEHRDTP